MEPCWLQAFLLCVVATSLVIPSHGEVAALRKILGALSQDIIDGGQASDVRYPYACAIYIGDIFACTGILVHPKVVVTAVHCGANGTGCNVHCSGIQKEPSEAATSRFGVFMRDPGYVGLPGYHDVALIRFEEGEYDEIPLPIVSRDVNEFKHGRLATAIGWGETIQGMDKYQQDLTIARDIIPTDRLCEYELPTLCGTSASARAAQSDHTPIVPLFNARARLEDSGGPLVIEGDSAEKDVVFGITSNIAVEDGLHVMRFTNLPYYLDKFISPHLRGIEKDLHADPPNCAMNPMIESEGDVRAMVDDCAVTFTVRNSAKNGGASVKYEEVARSEIKVEFDITIADFTADDLTDPGFRLDVYEDISLYIRADGRSAMWKHNGKAIAYSSILPGSGSHKVRIQNTETGFVIYEDGLKSAIVDVLFTGGTVEARFDTIAESAGLSYTISITSIRLQHDADGQAPETETAASAPTQRPTV